MKPSDAEREQLLQTLDQLAREQLTLNLRDNAAFTAHWEKLEALRQRIVAFRMRHDFERS